MEYEISAIEYAEDSSRASVCAVCGKVVFEDPEHTGMDIEDARAAVEEISASGIDDSDIERTWILLSQ